MLNAIMGASESARRKSGPGQSRDAHRSEGDAARDPTDESERRDEMQYQVVHVYY